MLKLIHCALTVPNTHILCDVMVLVEWRQEFLYPISVHLLYWYDDQGKIMYRKLWTATVDQWICCLNFATVSCQMNFCWIVWLFYHYLCGRDLISLHAMVYGLKSTHVSDIWHVTNQAYLGITDQLFKFDRHFCVRFITACKMAEKIQPKSFRVTFWTFCVHSIWI